MKMYDFLIIWYRKVDTGYRVQEAADKVLGLAVMEVLRAADHSLVRARCWPTLGLLAAGVPPDPVRSSLDNLIPFNSMKEAMLM